MDPRFPQKTQEFVDFINKQSAMFVDCLSGFIQNKVRMERQVHRVLRKSEGRKDGSGNDVMMHSSYEDPSRPEAVYVRIERTDQYIDGNSPLGYNEQQLIYSMLIFIYTFWEDEIRPQLAKISGVDLSVIRCDMMGEIRALRNCILHHKAVLSPEFYSKLNFTQKYFKENESIVITSDIMHFILHRIKHETCLITLNYLGVPIPPGMKE